MIISVHIPKCGGISFEHVLRSSLGRRSLKLRYDGVPDDPDRAAALLPKGTRCIHGHFPADAFDRVVPGADLVTWLRHPVERVISNYHHFLRHPDPRNPCCRELLERRLPLEAFAELPAMRNEATRYLAGKPIAAFRFIGITERYRESLQRFGAVFGLRVPAEPPRENANPERTTDTYPVPQGIYDHILALNLADFATYHSVLAAQEPAASTRPKAA